MNYLNGNYASIPFDRKEIPQSILNIEDKTRSNPLTWKAQFSPQFIEALINKYSSTGSVIYDPFLGSGTVLLEAGKKGLRAVGTEVNPAAVTISQLYRFVNTPVKDRKKLCEFIKSVNKVTHVQYPDLETVKGYFSSLIEKHKKNKDFLSLIEATIVLSDFISRKDPQTAVTNTWHKINNFLIELPYSRKTISIFNADARQTPLKSSSIDLVITSPPYINVYNYHQQYRQSVEFLNWEILKVAKSEIGANRKHRSNRFLTVIQYCLDIEDALREIVRVTKDDARIIFVVGRESTVRGTPFNNGELVADIAHEAFGLNLKLKQERVFKNKFGQMIYEDILHLKYNGKKNNTERSRAIALKALQESLNHAPEKSIGDIKAAIKSIDNVQPSPLLNNSAIKTYNE